MLLYELQSTAYWNLCYSSYKLSILECVVCMTHAKSPLVCVVTPKHRTLVLWRSMPHLSPVSKPCGRAGYLKYLRTKEEWGKECCIVALTLKLIFAFGCHGNWYDFLHVKLYHIDPHFSFSHHHHFCFPDLDKKYLHFTVYTVQTISLADHSILLLLVYYTSLPFCCKKKKKKLVV